MTNDAASVLDRLDKGGIEGMVKIVREQHPASAKLIKTNYWESRSQAA